LRVLDVGLVIAGMTMGTWWALVGMSIAAMGFLRLQRPVFRDATDVSQRRRARSRHSWDQIDRQSWRLLRPCMSGHDQDLTGSYAGGLYGLALLGLLAAIVCALFMHISNRMPSARRRTAE